jgi:hypothetical protein
MKIGIVTFFRSYNYGVWLQAVATQQFFLKNGFQAELINYVNVLEDNKTKYAYRENGKAYGYITSFIKSMLFGKVKYYKKGFSNYLNDYYKLSQKKYSDVKEMNELEYDVLVAGSDQLWNPETTSGELDRAFLLQFGRVKKRISVATSIGSDPVDAKNEGLIKDALSGFDAISVREQYAADSIHKFCDLPIKVIMDPTFLLTKNEWLKLAKRNTNISLKNEKYLLTYFISTDKRSERYKDMVTEYSKKLGVPVWAIQFSKAKSTPCDRMILGASISDFINLIHHAEMVLTDSFHGVALSLNLNADFVAVNNKKNPERVRYLLSEIGLLDRIDLKADEYLRIDYKKAEEKLNPLRADSAEWILNAINNERKERATEI